ncbi:MAG: exodeoxyribonuclease VII small subunit [Chromatiaceae bacterium]|nr:MAG: exodeoxyribonuclease VII small subunit [Chromatiaceae bacterium]
MSSDDPKQFEASLGELEALVERLEQGELTLEESLSAFERGINLTRACQRALEHAEQRVRILVEGSEDAAPQPFPRPNGAGNTTDNTAGSSTVTSPAPDPAPASAPPAAESAGDAPAPAAAPRRTRARRTTSSRAAQNPNDDLPL